MTEKNIFIIGAANAGKSKLLSALCGNEHDISRESSFQRLETTTIQDANNNEINLCYRVFSGNEQYNKMTVGDLPKPDVVLLCFELCKPASLTNLTEQLNKFQITNQNCQFILVGTKHDQTLSGIINNEAIKKWTTENNLKSYQYIETAAQTEYNIEMLNNKILSAIEQSSNQQKDNLTKSYLSMSIFNPIISQVKKYPYHSGAIAGAGTGLGLITAGITTMVLLGATPWVALLLLGIVALGLGAASAKKAYDSYQNEDEETVLEMELS